MDMKPYGLGILIEVTGEELASAYERRAALHAARAGKAEEKIQKLQESRTKLHAHDEDGGCCHPGVIGIGIHGPQQIEFLRSGVEEERRMHDYLTFMAEHIDRKSKYTIGEHNVRSLLGPLTMLSTMSGQMLGMA